MKKQFALICIFFSFVMAVSCSNGLTDMFESYNSNFTSADLVKSDNPGFPGFDPDLMLQPAYLLRSDGSVTLFAPVNCDSYLWALYSRDDDNTPIVSVDEGLKGYSQRVAFRSSEDNQQAFSLYVPDENLPIGTYKLVLTCTVTIDGQLFTYTDITSLVIYDAILGT